MSDLLSSTEWASYELPEEVVCWGAKGHSLMILQGLEPFWHGQVRLRAFVDELESGFDHPLMNVPVISPQERQEQYADTPVLLGVNSPPARRRIFAQLESEGASFTGSYGEPVMMVHPSARIGKACIIGSYTRIGSGTVIEPACQVLATMVAHDVHVGEGSTVGVYSSVLGNVEIGAEVNIAPHAVVHNGSEGRRLSIGDGAIVGVGAVVTRDVPPGGVVVGNPGMTVEEWRAIRELARRADPRP